MLIVLPKKKPDYVLLAANLVTVITGLLTILRALVLIPDLINIESPLAILTGELKSNYGLMTVYMTVGGVTTVISGCLGVYVAYYKQYSWYIKYLYAALGLVMFTILPLNYNIELIDTVNHKSGVSSRGKLYNQLRDALVTKYTGSLITTDGWSLKWDIFQLLNGCCGLDSPSDFLYSKMWEEWVQREAASGQQIKVKRKYPATCCSYLTLHNQNPWIMQQWIEKYSQKGPGALIHGLPSISEDGEFSKCTNSTVNTPMFISKNGCYGRIIKSLNVKLTTNLTFIISCCISEVFCFLVSLWYVYNQAYGLPVNMDIYVENIRAGLRRLSDPNSVVIQVNYPNPALNAQDPLTKDLLVNEKPGDAHVTKLFTVSKRKAQNPESLIELGKTDGDAAHEHHHQREGHSEDNAVTEEQEFKRRVRASTSTLLPTRKQTLYNPRNSTTTSIHRKSVKQRLDYID